MWFVLCVAKIFVLKTLKRNNLEIMEGLLICDNKHKFKINKGIPRFVVDKEKDFVKTEDAFSSKWDKYNKHYHHKKWFLKQQNWFVSRFGWKTLKNLNNFLKNKAQNFGCWNRNRQQRKTFFYKS